MAVTQKSLEELWLKALMAVLFGDALLGKEFAYLFLGEMVLLVGCVIFLRSNRLMLIASDPTLLLWGVFAFWGVCRTIPFLGVYGFVAIRDAALWGYGLVAVLIVAFVNHSNRISRALSSYRRFVAWLVPAIFVMLVLAFGVNFRPPAPPWAPESTFPMIKGGDGAVHLAGAALITFMFAPRRRASGKQEISPLRVMGYITWVGSTLIMLVADRAGLFRLSCPLF